jgi:CRP-like cAMP-binding protein
VRYESGHTLFREGVVPEQLQFLLDGTVTAKAGSQNARHMVPPAALGFEKILDGSVMEDTVRTSGVAVCLVLGRDEFRTLLSDNTDLVQGLFRVLAALRTAEQPVMRRRTSTVLRLPAGPLTLIERVVLLQQVPVFADIAAEEMRHLVPIASDVQVNEGSTLFTESDPSSVWVMLTGRAVLESAAGAELVTLGAGDVVGFFETLAARPIGRRAVATVVVRALRIDRDDLLDLCGQRPPLLQQLLSASFRAPATADDLRTAPAGTI